MIDPLDPPPIERATTPWYDVESRRELVDNMQAFYDVAREDLYPFERAAAVTVIAAGRVALRVLAVCARVVGQ